MSTYKELAYLVLDELRTVADDSNITLDHAVFLLDKYRAFLIKKNYTDVKKVIPDSNYQEVCLDLETVQGADGDVCSDTYLRSVQEIPELLDVATPRINTIDPFGGELTYVSKERFKFVGHNKFLRNFIYCTIGPDNKLYLKSRNPQAYYLNRVTFSGIFEDSEKASELSCSTDTSNNCDVLDRHFPLEDALIPMMIEFVVKELSGLPYRPTDVTNNASDDAMNKPIPKYGRMV